MRSLGFHAASLPVSERRSSDAAHACGRLDFMQASLPVSERRSSDAERLDDRHGDVTMSASHE